MSSTAANLVQRVFPEQDARQYVLTVPYQLRARLAYNPADCQRAIDIWTSTLLEFIQAWAKLKHGQNGEGGCVTFVQRFSSDLRLNVHFHTIALDGVYTDSLNFLITPPDDECLLELLREIVRRFEVAFLGDDDDSCIDPDDPMPSIYAAAAAGRSATPGARRGQRAGKLGTYKLTPYPDDEGIVSPACVRWGGFSLHAGVRMHGNDRDGIERLCRYTARGPIATNRLSRMEDGRLCYKLKRAWRDGTSAVALTATEFVERLMALIPPPWVNLTKYHGIFAPRHRWRARVVRDRASVRAEVAARLEEETRDGVWEALETTLPQFPETMVDLPSKNWKWADLLRRSFGHELLTCDRCGGERKVIATLTWPPVVAKFLACVGVESSGVEVKPARPPPEQEVLGW